MVGLVLAGCDNDDVTQIEWMIPMQPAQDHHSTSALARQVPTWAVHEGMSADISLLNKHKARRWDYHLTTENPVKRGDMTIELLGVAHGLRVDKDGYREDDDVDNPAAWLRIMKKGHIIHEGWMYQKFPELFGLDDPEWWISVRAVQQAPANRSNT